MQTIEFKDAKAGDLLKGNITGGIYLVVYDSRGGVLINLCSRGREEPTLAAQGTQRINQRLILLGNINEELKAFREELQ